MGKSEKLYFENGGGQSFHYLRYVPSAMSGTFPLVIFLHGAGERGSEDGSELDLVKRYFWFDRVDRGEEFPFIMAAPQCPRERYWGCYIESLERFRAFLLDTLPVDPGRVYLTGLSMGGTGSWLWSLGYPEHFAAVAPVCGTGVYWYGEKLADKPVWAFHGDLDDTVPPRESLDMVSSINRRGGHAKLTLLHGVGHDAWTEAYRGTKLMDWFLEQHI